MKARQCGRSWYSDVNPFECMQASAELWGHGGKGFAAAQQGMLFDMAKRIMLRKPSSSIRKDSPGPARRSFHPAGADRSPCHRRQGRYPAPQDIVVIQPPGGWRAEACVAQDGIAIRILPPSSVVAAFRLITNSNARLATRGRMRASLSLLLVYRAGLRGVATVNDSLMNGNASSA